MQYFNVLTVKIVSKSFEIVNFILYVYDVGIGNSVYPISGYGVSSGAENVFYNEMIAVKALNM